MLLNKIDYPDYYSNKRLDTKALKNSYRYLKKIHIDTV